MDHEERVYRVYPGRLCGICGFPQSPWDRVKNQRHPSWGCDSCGSGYRDDVRAYIAERPYRLVFDFGDGRAYRAPK